MFCHDSQQIIRNTISHVLGKANIESFLCMIYIEKQNKNSLYIHLLLLTNCITISSEAILPFLPRDALLSTVYAVVVCLSVCLCVCVCVSVTLRYCIKTAKGRITQITPHDNPLTLVFWHQSSLQNSKGITPYGGDKCRWGGLKCVTFDENRAITQKRYKIDNTYSFY